MSDPVALPLSCQFCGGEMTLTFEDWPDEGSEAGRVFPTGWTCPYWLKENRTVFPAKLTWVTKREPGPERLH